MTPAVWYRYRLFPVPAPVPGPVPVVSGPGLPVPVPVPAAVPAPVPVAVPGHRCTGGALYLYSCTKVVLVFLVWANEYQSVCSIAGEELHAGRASYPRRSLLQNEKKISSHYCFIIT